MFHNGSLKDCLMKLLSPPLDLMIQKLVKLKRKLNKIKYITTSEFNKLKTKNFKARLAQANLITKRDFDDKLKKLNKKINSNKTKHLFVKNEQKKNYKNLMQVVLDAKIILVMRILKIT